MGDVLARRKPGPAPRFSREDVVTAALAVVDESGFASLSLRAVARQLGVTSMAMYTYVSSREELCLLVIDHLVQAKVNDLVWPDSWQDSLRLLARGLAELIKEHPAMVEAYGEGEFRTEVAMRVADKVLSRLQGSGMPLRQAGVVYATVHAIVLGQALMRRAAISSATSGKTWTASPDLISTPVLTAYATTEGRLVDISLDEMLDMLLNGVPGTATAMNSGEARPG